jgi:DNA replication protein DnaC
MLIHPTQEKLRTLKLNGMAKALEEQLNMTDIDDLSFEERLGLLVDREADERENKRLTTRLKKARLRQTNCVEDIDFRTPRGLDKNLILALAGCQWVGKAQNVIITGPTGVGKTYLACALAHKACLEGYTATYRRLTKLFDELNIAKADGRYPKLMMTWAKTNLIILDDLGMAPLTAAQRHDLLELMEDRYGQKSTIVTSQLPVEAWHEAIGDPTIADAILDRIIHNAHKINLKGDSMRKRSNPLHQTDHLG